MRLPGGVLPISPRLTEREVIFVSAASPRKIQRALSTGGMVVALLDVLPEFVGVTAWREQTVPFFGRPARFPTSLLSVAARADATIVPFFGWVGADRRREFAFEEPRPGDRAGRKPDRPGRAA